MHVIGPRTWASHRFAVAFSCGLLALGACAPTNVGTQQDYSGAPLPRPDRVIVYNFAVSPDEVELDQGLSAELVRSFQSASTTEQERMAGGRSREQSRGRWSRRSAIPVSPQSRRGKARPSRTTWS